VSLAAEAKRTLLGVQRVAVDLLFAGDAVVAGGAQGVRTPKPRPRRWDRDGWTEGREVLCVQLPIILHRPLARLQPRPQRLQPLQDQAHPEVRAPRRACLRHAHHGRLCIVVGDVCLSRLAAGRHRVIPLHADFTVQCVELGFDNLAPIVRYKIANRQMELGGSSYFLGKPYQPNAIIKNDVERILLLHNPGTYRHPTPEQRALSLIGKDEYCRWFRRIWDDVAGPSPRNYPAP
jgi:hypothetical protein